MFIFISATCTSPLHVLQIEDPSIRTDNGLPRSELNDTLACVLLWISNYYKPNTTTTCPENGEWELATSLTKDEGLQLQLM